VRPSINKSARTALTALDLPSNASNSYEAPVCSIPAAFTAPSGSSVTSAPVSIRSKTSGMIAPFCGLRRRAFRTAAGGVKRRSSYGGIFVFQDPHCEIGYLFGPQEPRSFNPGRRQIFDAGDDDVYLCVLRKCHGFRQFDFATLDDCLVGGNVHRIQLITGSTRVAPFIDQQRRLPCLIG
jgi:hypothetical protein